MAYYVFLLIGRMGHGALRHSQQITDISLWSVLLWEVTAVPGKTTVLPQVIGNLYHIMLYGVHLPSAGFELTPLVVVGTDSTGRCKSNYPTIMTTTATYF